VKVITKQMTGEEMKAISTPVIEAMNRQQFEAGHTLDEVLMSTLYALGSALAQRGVVLNPDWSLRAALNPLAAGYEAKRAAMQREKEGQHAAPD
jgi:hypothetical protein